MNMTQPPQVALVSGFWGQNIGNAFFNIGGKWFLEQIFGKRNVAFVQDQPAYRTFNNKHKGNPLNDFNLLRYVDVKYVVLQGPMMTTSFRAIWENAFAEYKRKGIKVILLGAALFKFTDDEINAVKSFLKEYPPALISTRDQESYEAIKDCAEFTYSGIDSAFFVPKAYKPIRIESEKYITVNFDRQPEPKINVSKTPFSNRAKGSSQIEALDYYWQLSSPGLQKYASSLGKWQAYIGAMIDFRKLPPRIGEYTIVRPEHRFNPHITWKIYKQPNALASDEPFTYFTIYAGTDLTLSDRVHACVATLAYGNPVMLFSPSPRAKLFERLQLYDIKKRPVILDLKYLKSEQEAQLDFFKHTVAKIN